MKLLPSIQPISERFPALEEQEVTLTLYAPEAKVVQVAGNFNSWRPDANPLEKIESGGWITHLMLKSGQYEYRFVVDGVWTNDPQATQNATNPYGELNSILKVGLDDRVDLL
jgi:1,4-alpha-glucan branching enzyme